MIDDFRPAPGRASSGAEPSRNLGSNSEPIPSAVRPAPDAARPSAFRTPERVASQEPAAPQVIGSQPSASAQPSGPAFGSGAPQGSAGGASSDMLLPPSERPGAGGPKQKQPGKTITLFKRWTVPRKKFFIILATALVILGGGGTALALSLNKSEPVATKPATKKAAVAPTPAPIVSPLTGLPVTKEQQKLPVIGVMIENSPDARPQSGLKEAGVVYEAIAEAGITRFLALFQEAHPGNVGPVRSARPYYLDWAMGFDAAYAHVGGSPDALQRIKDIGVKDMDQFYNPSAYRRITSRYAPHNMYTSIDQLTDLARSKGYDTSSFTSFERKKEQPFVIATPTPAPAANSAKQGSGTASSSPAKADTRTPANSIDFAISGAYYNAHYDYDAASNSYKRSEGGAPHMDAESNTQLAPKVVIGLAMQYGLMADGYHSAYTTIGSGKMFVFQDGTVTTGTWTKGQPKEQFVFKDDAGKVIQLDPGQTWISVVGDPAKVSYK